jgi:hypothetical protein
MFSRLTTTSDSNPDRKPKKILAEIVRSFKLHVALVFHVNFSMRIGPNATGTNLCNGLLVVEACSAPKPLKTLRRWPKSRCCRTQLLRSVVLLGFWKDREMGLPIK